MDESCDNVLKWNPEGPSSNIVREFVGELKKDPLMASAGVFFTLPLLPVLLPKSIYDERTTKKFVEKNLTRLECKVFYGEEMGKKRAEFEDELRRKGYPFDISTCGGSHVVRAVLWDPTRSMGERDLIKIGMHVVLK